MQKQTSVKKVCALPQNIVYFPTVETILYKCFLLFEKTQTFNWENTDVKIFAVTKFVSKQ
jgi:hypothetical protein